jgi:hypothetical protein
VHSCACTEKVDFVNITCDENWHMQEGMKGDEGGGESESDDEDVNSDDERRGTRRAEVCSTSYVILCTNCVKLHARFGESK